MSERFHIIEAIEKHTNSMNVKLDRIIDLLEKIFKYKIF